MTEQAPLSRRTLLTGGAVTVVTLLGACASRQEPSAAPRSVSAPAASPRPSPTPVTVDALFARKFVIAHRGSGDNWPEHTLTAYLHASRSGADAIEISVRSTADGVLVCHHDADTRRVTGAEGLVADIDFSQLKERPVDARRWLGQSTALEPISSLDEVLAALPPECLVFIEDKDGSNSRQLLDVMDAQPRSTERFVWKQWAFAQQVQAARERGYRTWGYFTPDTLDRIDEVSGLHDALGVPVDASDEQINLLVKTGKPVIAWEVHTRSDRERLRSLGVMGLMCANVPYVLEDHGPATSDSFASGTRPPGDLPANYADGWFTQPRLEAGKNTLTLEGHAVPRYLLGSLCPVGAENFRVSFRVSWVGSPTGEHSRAGLAFCLEDDGPYHPRQANRMGSYQAFLNTDGRVSLAYQAAGWTASENLATIQSSTAATAEISVTVMKQKITLSADGQTTSVNHMDARGGYLWLWGEQLSTGARFSDIHITQL